jgi:hypothetical protein
MARSLVKIQTSSIPKLVKLSAIEVQLPAGLAPTSLTVNVNVSGVGGLDTGTNAVSSFYYVYLVNGVSLVSSLSSETPVGFSVFRKVGSYYTDSTGNVFKAYWFGEVNLVVMSAVIVSTTVSRFSFDFISSVSGTTDRTVNFKPDIFSIAPAIDPRAQDASATVSGAGRRHHCIPRSSTTTACIFTGIDNPDTAFIAVALTYLFVSKQGIDAIQPDWSL